MFLLAGSGCFVVTWTLLHKRKNTAIIWKSWRSTQPTTSTQQQQQRLGSIMRYTFFFFHTYLTYRDWGKFFWGGPFVKTSFFFSLFVCTLFSWNFSWSFFLGCRPPNLFLSLIGELFFWEDVLNTLMMHVWFVWFVWYRFLFRHYIYIHIYKKKK